MPHITLKMYKGRTEAQKQAVCDALNQTLQDTLGCSEEAISVSIFEYDHADWANQVFYPEIMAEEDKLYKKPGYKP